MINVIVELSKYIILTLMIVYTFHCFYTVRQSDEEDRNELLRQQLLLISNVRGFLHGNKRNTNTRMSVNSLSRIMG